MGKNLILLKAARKMVYWVRTQVFLLDDPGLIPSQYCVSSQPSVTQAPGDVMVFSGIDGH